MNFDLAAILSGLAVATVIGVFVKTQKMSRQIEDLHKWHAKTDEDGVPVWYVRKSLETAIEKLAVGIEQLAVVLREMHVEQQQIHKEVSDIKAGKSDV